jgi:O-antigen/teichoic acid export membrane protein
MNRLAENIRLPNINKDILRLSLSNVFNNSVTFVTGFIIAATVTAESFGIYSVSLYVVMTVFALGELGMGISIVKFYNKTNDDSTREKVLSSGITIKLAVSILLIILSYPLAVALSNILSPDYSIKREMMIAVLCASALGIWSFVRIINQAKQDYRRYAGLTLYYGLARLVIILVLLAANVQGAVFYLAALYLAGPLIVAVPAVIIFIKQNVIHVDSSIITYIKTLLSYGKWVMVGSILYPLCFSLPLFLIMRIEGAAAAGQFAVSLMFVALISPFNEAMRAYVLPKVSGFSSHEEAKDYIKKIRKFTLPFAFGILLIMFFSAVAYELFLNEKYPDGLINIILLVFAVGFTVFGGILNVVAHYLGLPHIDAWINIARIIFIIITCLIFIPLHGALGAVLCTAIALILGEIVTFILINKKLTGARI